MGEARRRGTFSERKAQAIAAGRIKGVWRKLFTQAPEPTAPEPPKPEADAGLLAVVDSMLGNKGITVVRNHNRQKR